MRKEHAAAELSKVSGRVEIDSGSGDVTLHSDHNESKSLEMNMDKPTEDVSEGVQMEITTFPPALHADSDSSNSSDDEAVWNLLETDSYIDEDAPSPPHFSTHSDVPQPEMPVTWDDDVDALISAEILRAFGLVVHAMKCYA